jgi:type II secretory pathway component GspD/PulD (secretin)
MVRNEANSGWRLPPQRDGIMKEGMLFRAFGIIAWTVLMVSPGIGSTATEDRVEEAPLAVVEEDKLSLKAEDRSLGEVLDEIHRQSGVEILGMEARMDEPVTFHSEPDAVEKVLKRLLRHLDETSFAFEYTRTRLRRISVLPSGGADGPVRNPGPQARVAQAANEPEKVNTVRILKVNEGTQAADLDLSQGDLIFEYDGTRINSARELVAAVKKKSPRETVEMVVVRDRQPFRLVLNGGLIGINILTVSVPRAELGL